VPGTPFVDELVRRLRLDGGPVEARRGGRQTADVVLHLAALDHPVTQRRLPGPPKARLWRGVVDEVVATRDTTEPLRITAGGLQWPR
jgi:hypothetical protein